MSHPSDDDLLELALSGSGSLPEVERHLRECAECGPRLEALRGEEQLLKRAFSEVSPPAHLESRVRPARPVRPRVFALVVAAALVVSALSHFVFDLFTRGPARPRTSDHVLLSLKKLEREMDTVLERMATTRDALIEPESQRMARSYTELISEAERRYAELVESYCDVAAPLTEDQRGDLLRVVRAFNDRAPAEKDRRKYDEDYREAVRAILNDDQFNAFEEFTRQEKTAAWGKDIDTLVDDLAGELDLRFSETESVRRALTSSYPQIEHPMIPVWETPSDILAEDPLVALEVRKSLRAEHHRAFEEYVDAVRRTREEARQLVARSKSDD